MLCFTYWAPEVCRQELFALHVVPESPSGLLQCGFVSRLPQFPQNQTSQQGVQVTCRAQPSRSNHLEEDIQVNQESDTEPVTAYEENY